MPEAFGTIKKSTNNGPVIYLYEVDGKLKNVVTGATSLNSALNGLRDLISAEPWAGQIWRIELRVASDPDE